MEYVWITEENIDDYWDHMDSEAAEYIFRKYGSGMALYAEPESAPQAMAVWKQVHVKDGKKPGVQLLWMDAEDQTAARCLLEAVEGALLSSGAAYVQYETDGKNEAVKEALQAAGYEVRRMESHEVIRTVGDFAALTSAKPVSFPEEIKSIDQLTFRQIHAGMRACVDHGKQGALEDLDALPFDWFEPKVSCCIWSSGAVHGFLLVHRSTADRLMVKLLGAWRPATKKEVLGMIRHAIDQAVKRYPSDTQVVLRPFDEATDALVRQMFPKVSRPVVWQANKQIIEGGK